MTGSIFDTHAHYDDEAFSQDRDSLLSSMKENGVEYIVNCGCELKSCLDTLALSEKYDFIYAAIGVHGLNVTEITEQDFLQIEKLYSHKKVVAVGEIGLDYHYEAESRNAQLAALERQLKTAKELDLPVIIHDREAHEDTMRLLTRYRPKGVVHCFSGSAELARQVVSLGMYVGLGGAITFKNARKPLEVAKEVPLDRILLETDCPYMTPVPFRGKRNDSTLIPYSARVIAGIKGLEEKELIRICCENGKALFSIPR